MAGCHTVGREKMRVLKRGSFRWVCSEPRSWDTLKQSEHKHECRQAQRLEPDLYVLPHLWMSRYSQRGSQCTTGIQPRASGYDRFFRSGVFTGRRTHRQSGLRQAGCYHRAIDFQEGCECHTGGIKSDKHASDRCAPAGKACVWCPACGAKRRLSCETTQPAVSRVPGLEIRC